MPHYHRPRNPLSPRGVILDAPMLAQYPEAQIVDSPSKVYSPIAAPATGVVIEEAPLPAQLATSDSHPPQSELTPLGMTRLSPTLCQTMSNDYDTMAKMLLFVFCTGLIVQIIGIAFSSKEMIGAGAVLFFVPAYVLLTTKWFVAEFDDETSMITLKYISLMLKFCKDPSTVRIPYHDVVSIEFYVARDSRKEVSFGAWAAYLRTRYEHKFPVGVFSSNDAARACDLDNPRDARSEWKSFFARRAPFCEVTLSSWTFCS